MNIFTDTKLTIWKEDNELAYEDLIVSIEANQGHLNLLICVCDSIKFREAIIDRYTKELETTIPCYRITLDQKEPSLRAAIAHLVDTEPELKGVINSVITATGVESLHSIQWNQERTELDKFFGYLQWTREGLREFPYSIVLWVTSTVEVNLRKKAPDFWSWRKGVFRFAAPAVNFVSCREFLPILQSFDEINTDNDIPLISLEDLLELIQQIETTKGEREPRLASLYASLGGIYKNRLERGQFEDYRKEQELAIEYYRKAIDLQKELNLELDLANSFTQLANLYRSKGQYREAIDLYQQSLDIVREIGDRGGEASSYNNLGIAYNFLGQYREAIKYLQQSLAIKREIGDRGEEANSYGNLGIAYNFLGQYREAIKFLQRSLAIFWKIGDRGGEANSYMGLGNAYYSLGQYREAIEFYQRSLAILREIGDRGEEANSYNNLGSAYGSLGQYQEAIEFHQQSLAIFREIGDRRWEANSYWGLGNGYYFLGQYQEAIEFYQQSLAIFREIGDRGGEASSLENLGLAYRRLGQHQQAIEYQQQSLAIRREIDNTNAISKTTPRTDRDA